MLDSIGGAGVAPDITAEVHATREAEETLSTDIAALGSAHKQNQATAKHTLGMN
jgi:hypothetical protein